MRLAARSTSVVATVAVLALPGCGASGDGGARASDTPSAGASRVGAAPSEPAGRPKAPGRASGTRSAAGSPVGTEDDAVEIEVEIEDGQVTPSGERVDVTVGQTVRFVVDSDAADQIHVHSTPEHTFGFPAGADDRTFELRVRQPGVVEAELHELGDVVVTLAARP